MYTEVKHPLIQQIVTLAEGALQDQLKPVDEELAATRNVIKALNDLGKDGKEMPQDKKQELDDNRKRVEELLQRRENVIAAYGAGESRVHQLIDIALLSNNMLKGEGLERFLKRSIGLLK